MKKKKKNNFQKRIVAILLALVLVIAAILLVTQIIKQENKNAELRLRKERLEQLIAEASAKQEELKEEESYVQNLKYIEEKAKSIGYIYPDEIIFRKDD